jgi:deazaflavin-dependent oxidoreductase (nitroreductase family)
MTTTTWTDVATTSNVATRTLSSEHWRAASPPRIELGRVRDIGVPSWVISRIGGLISGGGRVRAADALALSRWVFLEWLGFAIQLVPFTHLTRTETELATLRTAWNAGARYEFFHHVHFSRLGGLSPETVERVTRGPDDEGWSERHRALLTAVDELHSDRMISDGTWARLREFLDHRQLVELCMIVGCYEMLAMVLKSVGVEPEPLAHKRGPVTFLRRPDDSDALLSRRIAAFNRAVTNPILGPVAGVLPPYGLVIHRGRSSGREYRTPVMMFRDNGTIAIPLAYGDRAEWVRNLLAAQGGAVRCRGRDRPISQPRIVDATATDGLPRQARFATRIVKVLAADLG